MSENKCKNHDGSFVETIEAYHQIIFNGKEFYRNNEYGGQIQVQYHCNCGITTNIKHDQINELPKNILEKIEILKKANQWFFSE